MFRQLVGVVATLSLCATRDGTTLVGSAFRTLRDGGGGLQQRHGAGAQGHCPNV